jgi:hypothetical protein
LRDVSVVFFQSQVHNMNRGIVAFGAHYGLTFQAANKVSNMFAWERYTCMHNIL